MLDNVCIFGIENLSWNNSKVKWFVLFQCQFVNILNICIDTYLIIMKVLPNMLRKMIQDSDLCCKGIWHLDVLLQYSSESDLEYVTDVV